MKTDRRPAPDAPHQASSRYSSRLIWRDFEIGKWAGRLARWRGAGIVALGLIVVGVYARVAILHQYDWIWSPDLVYQVYPWLEVQAAAFRSGQLPLWDPYIWGGQPLLGQVQPGGAYPLNWLLYLLPQRDGFIRYGFLDWYFVVIHLLAAWSSYLLCRGLGCSRAAAVLGGSVFSLGGYLGRTDWPQMMNSAIWTPLVFLAILRAPNSRRLWTVASLGGLALGLAWLSGHHQVPVFLSIAAGVLWLFEASRGGVLRTRMVAAAGLFFVCTGLIAALQILPSLEYGREAVRWVGLDHPVGWKDTVPYAMHEGLASRPYRILGWVIPNNFDQYDHYLGFAALSLALIGVAATWRRRETRILFGIALFSVFFALGGYTAFHGLLYALVPLVEKARTPAAFSGLFSAAMAAAAAIGFDAIRSRKSGNSILLARKSLVTAALLLFALGTALFYANGMNFPTDDRFLLSALVALLFGGLLFVWEKDAIDASWFITAAIGLAVAELSLSALLPFPAKVDANRKGAYSIRHQYDDVAAYLREVPGHQRAELRADDFPITFGDLYQIPVYSGYTASVPARFNDLGLMQKRNLELYGVSTYVGKAPLYEGQAPLKQFESGVTAWAMEEAFPRTWLSHQTTSLDSTAALFAKIQDGEYHSRALTPFVGEAPTLPACTPEQAAADRAEITAYGMNRVSIRASSACESLLILSDNSFPGWRATVDGRETPILRPFHALRGVVIPPGEHRVEFNYLPRSFVLGAALSLAGLLLVIGIAVWERRKDSQAVGEPPCGENSAEQPVG